RKISRATAVTWQTSRRNNRRDLRGVTVKYRVGGPAYKGSWPVVDSSPALDGSPVGSSRMSHPDMGRVVQDMGYLVRSMTWVPLRSVCPGSHILYLSPR